jgi:hypothetical protein
MTKARLHREHSKTRQTAKGRSKAHLLSPGTTVFIGERKRDHTRVDIIDFNLVQGD